MVKYTPEDVTCPRCAMAGPCRLTHGGHKASPIDELAKRPHRERFELAEHLNQVSRLADQLGLDEDTLVPAEVESIARFGDDEDRELAGRLLAAAREAGVFEREQRQ